VSAEDAARRGRQMEQRPGVACRTEGGRTDHAAYDRNRVAQHTHNFLTAINSGFLQRPGGAPKSATPPNFNGPKQIAMVVRQFASAIRRQKFRAEVFRQRHPVLPACTHAASWSRRPAANALTQVSLIERSFASDRKSSGPRIIWAKYFPPAMATPASVSASP
jgi:hypothetical protein